MGLLSDHARPSARRGSAGSVRAPARGRSRRGAGRRTAARLACGSGWPRPRPNRAASPRARCVVAPLGPVGGRTRASASSDACARARQVRPIMTFSSALRCANRRMFWNVRPMPCAASLCGGQPVMRPAARNDTLPASGGMNAGDQVEQRGLAGAVGPDDRHDLARARTAKLTPMTATSPPKRLVSPSTRSIAHQTAT